VASFALDLFERQAEGFWYARAWREWQFLSGQRPGRELVRLYEEDFPDFTSTDLWADLQAASAEDPRQHRALSGLLAVANLEGRTRDFAVSVTRIQSASSIAFEDGSVPWHEVPARWALLQDVPRRHELEEGWRRVWHSELNLVLERWQEALRTQLGPLGANDWLGFWSGLRALDLSEAAKLADSLIQETSDVYAHGLGIYLNQLDLPIDDVWTSDVDWAFRAPRFDAVFAERSRMPLLIRALRDLGIELGEQTSIQLEYGSWPGVRCIPIEVPKETHVIVRLNGGWQDYANCLRGLGQAEHLAHADPSLRFWERSLGDPTPTIGYGLLFESLTRDKTWLAARMEYTASDDYRAINHLAWLHRLRRQAATALYEQRLWQAEPGASMSVEYEETLTGTTRVRHFPDTYLEVLLDAPWSALRAATWLRAEVFAAQVRVFLRREFDEEWWRSGRAAHFIKDELWRPGRRYTAEELLGFMGFEGFDSAILSAEFEEVLRPL
jgi:hypothetical protein